MDRVRANEKDDVLAQRTRARLFTLLVEMRRAAHTAELAERLALHPNGVRAHLERMERAGLIQRDSEKQERGRPRDLWRVAPGARPGGRDPEEYSLMSQWLVRVVKHGTEHLDETARSIGRELVPDTPVGGNPVETVFATLGFRPVTRPEGAGGRHYCLRNCPYRDAVRDDPERIVCRVHRGVTEGVVEKLAPDYRLDEFVAKDPDEAGCEALVVPIEPTGTTGAAEPRQAS